MHSRLFLTAITALVAFQASPAFAQQQPEQCTYSACALRLDHGFWRNALVRGAEGTKVMSVGPFSRDLDRAFQGSDSALVNVAQFRQRGRRGSYLLAGAVLAAYGGALFTQNESDGIQIGVACAGLIMAITGGIDLRASSNALHRAIWWHNQSLADR